MREGEFLITICIIAVRGFFELRMKADRENDHKEMKLIISESHNLHRLF